MTKILAFSDIHVHNWPQYSQLTSEGLNDRLLDTIACIDQVRQHALSVGAKVVLFGGDLFQQRRHVVTTAFNAAYDAFQAFKENDIELVAIDGNHDQADGAGQHHALHGLRDVCTVLDEPGWYRVGPEGHQLDVLAVPYTEDREAIKALCSSKSMLKGVKYPKILLGHLGVQGALLGADFVYRNLADCTVEDLNAKSFDIGLIGHFHLHQKLAKNLYYIGATLQHNWGDRGQIRGFVEYDTVTKKLKQIETKAPKFVELEDVEDWEQQGTKGNFVRLATSREIGAVEREEIRVRIGARSFETVDRVVEKAVQSRTSMEPGEAYDSILRKYIETKAPDLDYDKLAELGAEILKEAQ